MTEIRSLLDALGDPERRAEAIERLVSLGAAAVPWVSARVRIPDPEVRRAVQEVLVRIGSPAVDSLCELLRSRYEPDRRLAAEALGRIGDRRAVVPLCDALRGGSDSVTVVAATALGRIGDPRANDPLCVALSNHNPRVRLVVVRALQEIGTDLADSFLTVLYRHRDVAWRDAADVLIELGDPRALVPLRMALTDISAPVRCTAAAGLGRLGDLESVPKLCTLLRDPDPYVREAAAFALETLALSHPAALLRQALPHLDRLSRAEKMLSTEECTFTQAAQTIRTATDALARQPIPASAPVVTDKSLPVPAAAIVPAANAQPIPSSAPDTLTDGQPRGSVWWKILSRRRG